jgi:large subunit ribosomal protein L23
MKSNILKKALVSEKSFKEAALGKFTFVVDKDATKEDVSKAIKNIFDVDIIAINLLNVKGKVKRTKKGLGKRSDFKKAILTLKKGQKIDLFEVEKPEDKNTKAGKEDKKVQSNREEKTNRDTTVKVREKKNNTRKVIG